MKTNKRGVSLIVLVITIIIMIIIAGAIILALNGSGVLGRATEATVDSDIANKRHFATLALAEYDLLVNGGSINPNDVSPTTYVREKLQSQGIDGSDVTITDNRKIIIMSFVKTTPGELAIGSELKASNGEQFYVIGGDEVGTAISANTQKIILLAKYNLGSDGKQDATGAINPCIYCLNSTWAAAKEENNDSNLNNKQSIKADETSTVYKANMYGSIFEVTGRLLLLSEATELQTSNPEILYGQYESVDFLNYWIGTSWYNAQPYFVDGENEKFKPQYPGNGFYGVRPVIEIPADLVK